MTPCKNKVYLLTRSYVRSELKLVEMYSKTKRQASLSVTILRYTQSPLAGKKELTF